MSDRIEQLSSDTFCEWYHSVDALLDKEDVADLKLRIAAALRAERDKALEEAAKKADEEAAKRRMARVSPGDLERNYYGGGMKSAEELAGAIRAMKRLETLK